MKPLSLDEVRDLAPAFVMGTLTAEELAQFEQAMANPAIAEEMAPELAAHRAALEFLATEHAVTPPPALRDKVIARIAAESTHDGEVAMPVAPRQSTPRAVHVAPLQIVRRASRAPWIGMAVFGTALAASLVFSVDMSKQVRGLQDSLENANGLLKAAQNRLASRDETVRILTEGGSKLVFVKLAVNAEAGPDMQLFWNTKDGTAVMHASGFKQVASNRTYCLWMIRDGKPVPIKLFNPDADGHRLINDIALPKDVQGIAAFAVTEEPSEGSPQPTMTPFLVGTVGPK